MDGVDARAGARVTARGAAVRGLALSRGVRDAVAGAGAATLEGVVETDPVTSLVGQSLRDDIPVRTSRVHSKYHLNVPCRGCMGQQYHQGQTNRE